MTGSTAAHRTSRRGQWLANLFGSTLRSHHSPPWPPSKQAVNNKGGMYEWHPTALFVKHDHLRHIFNKGKEVGCPSPLTDGGQGIHPHLQRSHAHPPLNAPRVFLANLQQKDSPILTNWDRDFLGPGDLELTCQAPSPFPSLAWTWSSLILVFCGKSLFHLLVC